ncbi:MAG: hypothetical protein RDU20_00835 [Desulfomonilaceae bacterium]|nr:hypothetical protein [Desulfomonilaceae bacterium]
MAKLKDLVSPEEVLEAIRGGALKHEVIKKYKTSEQELARLLLPLYRAGDLSKEEFNDFFKGVPLRPQNAPSEPETQEVATLAAEDEPPSAIVRSLSAEPQAEPPVDHPPEPKEAVEEHDIVEEHVAADEHKHEVSEPVLEDEFLPDLPSLEELPVAETKDMEPFAEPLAAAVAGGSGVPLDSAGMSSVLEAMFAKLSSIDNRLAAIEKKLDGTGR